MDFKLDESAQADEIRLMVKPGAQLRVDDVLLYEPGG